MLSICAVLLAAVLPPVSAIWPAPKSFTKGSSVLYLHQNIIITYNGDFLPYTYGYSPRGPTSREMVQAAVSRAMGSIFDDKFVPWMLYDRGQLSRHEPDVYKGQKWLTTFKIWQTAEDRPSAFKPLAGEVDESYKLEVTANGEVTLTAVSSIGILRGLETFTQLFFQHSTGTFWYTPFAPLTIEDAPKFPHRGVMLDTARHWFPVADIKRTIDAMAWNKLNRLHIHATDSQSWPLEIPSMPELAQKGAYSPAQIYTKADLNEIYCRNAIAGGEVMVVLFEQAILDTAAAYGLTDVRTAASLVADAWADVLREEGRLPRLVESASAAVRKIGDGMHRQQN